MSDVTRDAVEFTQMAQDYTDEESLEILTICADIDQKYRNMSATPQALTAMEDEAKTRLAAINVLATVVPREEGGYMIDIIGKLKGDSIHKYGFDHEKKQWEVRRATERGEAFLGQKERTNKRKEE